MRSKWSLMVVALAVAALGASLMVGCATAAPRIAPDQGSKVQDMKVEPTDPAVILALKADLSLTDEQVRKLEGVVAKAHADAAVVLSDEQTRKLMLLAQTLRMVRGLVCLTDGAWVEAASTAGAESLQYAVQQGKEDIARTLIAGGADVNAPDAELGNTPLHTAVYACRQSVTLLLLSNGADPNLQNQAAQTPLHAAALCGAGKELVLLLLRHRADPNVRDASGQTPLHTVAGGQHWTRQDAEVAALLVEYGAQSDIKDKNGKTALDLARERGHEDLVRLLNERR